MKCNKKPPICVGEYSGVIKGKALIFIPCKWRKLFKRTLYCIHCEEDEYSYLRFFKERESLEEFLKQENNQKIARCCNKRKRISCSVHRVLGLIGMLRLPDAFWAIDERSDVCFVGCIDSFEVWRKCDWNAMTENSEVELEEFLDDMNKVMG